MIENSNKKIITMLVVIIILVVVAIFGFLLYIYLQIPEHKLNLGANIENAIISPEKDIVYIKLAGRINYGNITKIKFIFKDNEGNEYNYETSEGTQEISVPFKRSFWDWLLGKEKYEGIYDYEINANEINLNNFENINEVSVLFEYKTETNQTIITPPLDTTKPTPVQNKTTSSGGGGGEGGTSEPTPSCTNDAGCSSVGSFCDGSMPFNCILNIIDGCLDRVNGATCGVGQYCEAGSCKIGCVDECGLEGSQFCYGIIPFNCTRGSDGCLKRILNTPCPSRNICSLGECIIETVPNQILYEDDFQDGNYNETDPNLTNGLTWDITSGNALVDSNKKLGLLRQNGSQAISQQVISSTEFTLEFDLTVTWSIPSKAIFLYLDENNYYYFSITGSFGVYRVMNGETKQLDDRIYQGLISLPHSGGSFGRYKLYLNNDGSRIMIKVDKNGFSNGIDYEMEIIDEDINAVSKFINGKIGFGEKGPIYSGYWVSVDNVKVYNGLKNSTRIRPIETFYVSLYGNDSNSGSQSQPWRTIQKAASELMAGDTVLIAPGIYQEGNILTSYSGTKGYPITYKALNPNNKPILTGDVNLDTSRWSLYSGNISKAIIDRYPTALYINDTPLFVAQYPNQENPDDQMQLQYFIRVNETENNNSLPKSHFTLIDKNVLTQVDNYLNGATLLIHDNYINAIGEARILDNVQSSNKIVIEYMQWITVGQGDFYALRDHLSLLDKPGEYFINRGNLKVTGWTILSNGNISISIKKISGIGNATAISIHLMNQTYIQRYDKSANFGLGDTINLELSSPITNVVDVFSVVQTANKYELYVWPYEGFNINNLQISQKETLFNLRNGYNEYTIFDGLEIKHYMGAGLDFDASGSNRNCIVRNCNIHHNLGGVVARCDTSDKTCSDDSIHSRCEGLVIENSRLHNNYGQGASFGGGKNFTVQRCEIYENLADGIWSGNGGNFLFAVCDVKVLNNYIHHQGSARGHPDGIQLYKTAYSIIDGNYLVQEGHQNTWFEHGGPLWFTNNIVIGGPAGLNSANYLYVYNNIFYGSTARMDAHQAESVPYEINVTEHGEMRNNVFINCSYTMPPEILWKNIIKENNIFITDKNFSDYFSESVNFTPKINSPLIDAGYFLVPAKKDYAGNRRWQGLRPDIGAIESYNQYSYEDCLNGIKDGNEEGVDCGGICIQDFDNDGYVIGLCFGLNDCNDSNPLINPGAEEICNGIDNNCDGQLHPNSTLDSDSDGFDNCIDNCPLISNPSQEDFDNDKSGDICDNETTYIENFDLRFTGENDLDEIKVPNGLSWGIISGIPNVISSEGGKALDVPGSGANQSDRCLLTAKQGMEWQNLTLSLRAKKAWSPTNPGFVFLYKDTKNYYFFNIRLGSLIKRVDGNDSVVGSNSLLSLDHSDGSWHNYTIDVSVGGKVSFAIKKDNMTGPIVFNDNTPHSIKGTIGFLRDNGLRMDVDDIVVTVKSEVGEAGTFSPFAKLWNFFKSLLTAKTGNAITGNAVANEKSFDTNDKNLLIKFINFIKNLFEKGEER